MGLDPATSPLNHYQQSWDAHNLFVIGASSFPNSAGYNPSGKLSALTLWTAKAVINDYLRQPGLLTAEENTVKKLTKLAAVVAGCGILGATGLSVLPDTANTGLSRPYKPILAAQLTHR